MAKTNVTTTTISTGSDDYLIHQVNSNQTSSIDDATINAENEIIIASNNASDSPVTFSNDVVITGNENVVPFVIKNYRKDIDHWQNGINFNANSELSNVSILSAGAVSSNDSSSIHKWRNVYIKLLPNRANTGTLIRLQTGSVDIDGLIVDGGSCSFWKSNIVKLDNYSPRNMEEGLMKNTEGSWVTFKSFNPVNCTKDCGFSASSQYVFYGYAIKAPTMGFHFNWTGGQSKSMAVLRKKIALKIVQEDAQVIEDVTTKFHSQPQNKNLYNGAGWKDNFDNQIDTPIEYNAQSDSIGLINLDVVLAFIGRPVGNEGRNSAPKPVLYLSHSADYNYQYTVLLRKSGFLEQQVSIDCAGLDETVEKEVVLEIDEAYDTSVNVSSVTGIDITNTTITVTQNITLQELYNYLKSWLSETSNFEVADFVSVDGDELSVGAYDVLVYSATLSASTNLKKITSSGTITTANSGDLQVVISDSQGDSNGTLILPAGFTTASIHATESDADNNTNAIATGLNFRYKSSELGGQVRWVRATGSAGEIVTSVTIPTDAGAHTFEVLVTPVDASLARIENKQVDLLDKISQIQADSAINTPAIKAIETNTQLSN